MKVTFQISGFDLDEVFNLRDADSIEIGNQFYHVVDHHVQPQYQEDKYHISGFEIELQVIHDEHML